MSYIARKFSTARKGGIKVVILGQSAVGKTALTVRFLTKRFIYDYAPNLEKRYNYTTRINKEQVHFEILDTAGQEEEKYHMEANLKGADAFILLYSVTDKYSMEKCHTYKFLINRYAGATLGAPPSSPPSSSPKHKGRQVPVLLIGNKTDLSHESLISEEESSRFCDYIGCTRSYTISVKESPYSVIRGVFSDIYSMVGKSGSPRLAKRSEISPPFTLLDTFIPEENNASRYGDTDNGKDDSIERHFGSPLRERRVIIDGAILTSENPKSSRRNGDIVWHQKPRRTTLNHLTGGTLPPELVYRSSIGNYGYDNDEGAISPPSASPPRSSSPPPSRRYGVVQRQPAISLPVGGTLPNMTSLRSVSEEGVPGAPVIVRHRESQQYFSRADPGRSVVIQKQRRFTVNTMNHPLTNTLV